MTKENEIEISVVIPAFNEQSGIRYTIESLNKIISSDSRSWECIVVDDGSWDKTAEIAESCGVKVIQHRNQKGYGAALKTGILAGSGDIICITDADDTYPNDQLPFMVDELINGSYDMVVGDRQGEQIKSQKARGLTKWALKKIANWLVNEKIPDLNSGLRVFRREPLYNFLGLLPSGFSFTTTITLAMLTNEYSVRYYPVNYYPRKGKSKIRPVYDTIGFVNLIFKIGLYFKPLKIFFFTQSFTFSGCCFLGFVYSPGHWEICGCQHHGNYYDILSGCCYWAAGGIDQYPNLREF